MIQIVSQSNVYPAVEVQVSLITAVFESFLTRSCECATEMLVSWGNGSARVKQISPFADCSFHKYRAYRSGLKEDPAAGPSNESRV